jgi:hypothetical protein
VGNIEVIQWISFDFVKIYGERIFSRGGPPLVPRFDMSLRIVKEKEKN